jgi:hypothetical protein
VKYLSAQVIHWILLSLVTQVLAILSQRLHPHQSLHVIAIGVELLMILLNAQQAVDLIKHYAV